MAISALSAWMETQQIDQQTNAVRNRIN